ncbi:MAG TPA: DUF1592 domain-containing protein [Polyangiaceae bacterium]|nr:DUF1592 domain-containing protein [Polyangiaceae bacterium]
MKRASKALSKITVPFTRGPRLLDAGLALALLVAGSSCTNGLADGESGSSGAGATSSMAGGANSGAGMGTGMGTAGGSQPGAGGSVPESDPYTVPANPPAAVLVATPRFARLSRQQWENAVKDLLKVSDISEITGNVSGDALIAFDNEADDLFVTEQLRSQLFDASEKLADKVTADATALGRLLPANAPTDAAGRAKAFITSFGQRAFRRPLTDAEVTTHVGLFNSGTTLYPGVDAFKAGASLVIQAVLQSPYFLYRTELGTAAAGAPRIPLNDWEVAAKLALSITNTIPDDALLAAAAAGELHDAAGIAKHANRLLDGATGADGVSNFNLQVFRLGAYDGIIRNAADFPEFTTGTPAAMKLEVLQFLSWVFRENRGIKDFYTAPVGFVNSLLAPLYGLNGTFSTSPTMLTKVDLDPTQRTGLLTQAGFLSSYISVGNEPDIIHRGVFIAERLLCKELPPPPAAAAGVMIKDTPGMTNRERVEMTTGKGTCGQSCHGILFNPLGFAFENYDAVGKYRATDQDKPVNAADSYMLDGQLKSFTNGVELSKLLAETKEVHACYVRNILTYLHGQEVDHKSPMVDYYARRSRAGMTLRDLELAIVSSEDFLNRLP